MARIRNVALFGHYGTMNLGDEALIRAAIATIRERHPGIEICGFSMNPADTRQRHGIEAFPVRRYVGGPGAAPGVTAPTPDRASLRDRLADALRKVPPLFWAAKKAVGLLRALAAAGKEAGFLFRSVRNLKGVDLVLVAGSGQLTDHFGGVWDYPWDFLKWSLLTRLLGKRLAYASLGAGPMHSGMSRRLFRWSLSLAEYRSLRDHRSKALIDEIGVKGENRVCPDLANTLDVSGYPRPEGGRRTVVGVNPMPYYSSVYWQKHDLARYGAYVEKLAAFVAWLLREGHDVRLFPTHPPSDSMVVEDVRKALAGDADLDLDRQLFVSPVKTVDDLLALMATFDFTVGSRFHSVVISYLMGKPALAITYSPKIDALMRDLGQPQYCLSIDDFDLETLQQRFRSLEKDRQDIARRVGAKVAEYREALERQYDDLLGGG